MSPVRFSPSLADLLMFRHAQMSTERCVSKSWSPTKTLAQIWTQQRKLLQKSSNLTSDILFPYRSPSPRPHPDPTQHPDTDPKRTRNRPETDPKRSQTESNGPETDRNGPKRSRNGPTSSSVGWDGRGALSGWGRVGVVREKENH